MTRESKPSASSAPLLMEHRNPKTFGFLPLRSDRTIAQGTLACTAAGGLIVDVEGERYRIEAGDVKGLIFSGRPAPVMRERCEGVTGLTIEGHAAVHPAGRAVVIRTRAGAWIVPLASFQRVACGEEVRAPVLGLVSESDRLLSESLSTYLRDSTP
ncbi:hypothetical protein [Methanoculleus oceani]|uniref:hypothetical protein n=1 Tax=Methanoculleus oceani TaxID=2184756 RepID=UPI00203353DB|nr:hypothetical protein [Methanoculleus sp. CWC-02]